MQVLSKMINTATLKGSLSCHPRGAVLHIYVSNLWNVQTRKNNLWTDWAQGILCPKEVFAKITRKLFLWPVDWQLLDWKLKTLIRISITFLPARVEMPSSLDVTGLLALLINTPCLCLLIGTLFGLLPESVHPGWLFLMISVNAGRLSFWKAFYF